MFTIRLQKASIFRVYDPNTNLETALIINTLSKVSFEDFECTVNENNIGAPKSKILKAPNCQIFSIFYRSFIHVLCILREK